MPANSPPSPDGLDGPEVTQLLHAWRAGDQAALDELLPVVYRDLKRLARNQLRRDPGAWTLDATALVNEAYLRLAAGADVNWENRGHFLGVAARAMRQVVAEYARRRLAAKRGGGDRAATLDERSIALHDHAGWLLDLDRALQRLGEHDPRLVQVVECRFFAGLTAEETAAALEVSLRTVERSWSFARSWLLKELQGSRTS